MSKVKPRIYRMIRSALVAAVASALFLGMMPRADASVAIYDIGAVPAGQAGGFGATFLHAATSSKLGSRANGGRRSGRSSNLLTGLIQGDLNGNILSGIFGEVSGMLKGLGGSHRLFGNFSTTPFILKLGSSAGGTGALAFETGSADQFTGGFLDYELFIGTDNTPETAGTFFFQPATQMDGDAPLAPNRGTSDAFTLWGNNYMHDGNNYDEDVWSNFLSGLPGYDRQQYVTRRNVGKPRLGIDIYAERRPTPAGGSGGVVPEPESMAAWVLIAGFGLTVVSRNLEMRHRVTVNA